jgi:HlyD family secretion protein
MAATSNVTTPALTISPTMRGIRWARIVPWAIALLVIGAVVRQRFFVAIPVRAQEVSTGDVVVEVFGRGTIESRREVQLGFDMVGRISDLLVDEGDRVKLGQVLGHLAPEQFAADFRTASSGVTLARAAIARLQADEHRATATIAFATAEESRIRSLAASGNMSTRELDLAVQQLELARAELERVRASRDEATRQIGVASKTAESRSVTAARAALVSPFDGIVVRRLRDTGDTVTVGTTVLRVVATDALWSRAWVDEAALPQLREGQPVRVRLGSDAKPSLLGTVDRIGREVDRQTHELLVDVLLTALPPRVAIGQRADVWIEVDRRKNVQRAPLAFLHREGDKAFCYVSREGKIRRLPVILGALGNEDFEVTTPLPPNDLLLDALDAGALLPEGRRWRKARP